MALYCVTGIDTDIGKTVATGMIARWLLKNGNKVITFKPVQTGCGDGTPEDILTHRGLMGISPLTEDREGITCPCIFPMPASPALAAREAGRKVDIDRINSCLRILEERYETVLMEGAGGLKVPLREGIDFLDYLETEKPAVILVTAPKLGSINHTLLSLEALAARNIPVAGLIYNRHFTAAPEIEADSRTVFLKELSRLGLPEVLIDLPAGNCGSEADFSALFQSSF